MNPVYRPWLVQYPAGMPDFIDTAGKTLPDLMEASFAQFGSRTAYVCMDKGMTYGEVDALSRHFAGYLQALGLPKGSRIAMMMPNCLQYPIAMFAALRAGYVVVSINPLYTPRELEHQLKDSGAQAIVILENFAHVLQQVVAHTEVKHVVVAALGDLLGLVKGNIVNLVVRKVKKMVPEFALPGHVRFNDALRRGAATGFRKPVVVESDVAFLQYTGGTTGVSKGAVLTHRNIASNVVQCVAWYQPALKDIGANTQVVKVMALPLYHIFALTAVCFLGASLGGKVLLVTNARDFPDLLKILAKYMPHVFPAVNTLFNALMNHPDFEKVDWTNLKLSVGGGMAVQGPVAKRWFERTGCSICEGYGLSETSPVATCNRTDSHEYTGTIGIPVPSTDISIRDDDGYPCAVGAAGEICIKGPQVMAGYWNRPEETRKVMTPDGYFKSGDIGVMDERGYTKIVDRKKDMILVSGFNVYPNEVEEVVAACPGVAEVAAVGVPDEHSGETVKVFVVKKDPSLTEAQVMDFCKQNLTGYKRPHHIEFRADLPKTNVGKILRRILRDEALKK
jgi:long-chain acyl-CoA synthetase